MSVPENFSILAMPIYWGLCMVPHGFAIYLACDGNPLKWDNRNPRSEKLKANVKAKLSPDNYALWERAESASANTYENMAFFFGAVIIGKISGVDNAVLDKFAATFLALRVAHTTTYLLNSGQALSAVRSVVYFASVWQCVKIYLAAAKVPGY